MAYYIYVSDVLCPILADSRVEDFSPELNEVFEQEKTEHSERKEESEYDGLGVIDAQIFPTFNPTLAFQLLQL
jgi:hypothetical protein